MCLYSASMNKLVPSGVLDVGTQSAPDGGCNHSVCVCGTIMAAWTHTHTNTGPLPSVHVEPSLVQL